MKGSRNGEVPVRGRVFILGVLVVVVNAYWVGIASELWYTVYTLVNPFSNAVFTLACLLGGNALVRRRVEKAAFSTAELLVLYIMVTMVSTISGHAFMAILMGTLAHPFWFASSENQYGELFLRFIPSWMTVRDPELLRGYFEGDSSFYKREHFFVWLRPIGMWSLFLLTVWSVYVALGLILRAQWTEHEKLSYPLTQLPLQMVTSSSFWHTGSLWVGFSMAGGIRLLNAVGDLVPSVLHIPPNLRVDQYLVERPWNQIGYISLSFNPAIVGLTFFMPLDLAFSCWFFFWLGRFERVFASVVGWQNLHLDERASGGWLGIAVLALWSARRHLIRVGRHLAGLRHLDESREPIPYRYAVILLGLSVAGIFLFCLMGGMHLWVVGIWFVLSFGLSLALGHVRAALGPPYHEVININPRQMMVHAFGTRRLGGENLTMLSMLYALDRCHRSHGMPAAVEMLRIGELSRASGKSVVGSILLAVGVGTLATFWAYLHLAYHYGATARFQGWVGNFGWEVFNPLQRWLLSPVEPDRTALGFMVGGFLFVLGLHAIRTRWLQFPLHASGYVLSGGSWGGMVYFWFPVMVSWALKFVLLKWGGLPAYHRAGPFFLGLVLGDFLLRSGLSLVSMAFNVYMPSSGAGHSL